MLTLPLPAMAMTGFMTVWLSFWSIACLALVIGAGASWVAVVREGEKSKIPTAILLTLFAAPFCAAWGFGVYMISEPTTFWTPVVLVAAAGLLVLYAFLLPAPTFEGRRIMDEIEGFAAYLRGRAGGDASRAKGGIDADEFERWLPYAVALDASDDWAAYFESVVESTLSEEGEREIARREWRPIWFHGPHHMLHPATFCESVGSSLASSVSSSSSAPGSSSGFSGGGSSGGGGGGGGGGGW